jgi:hypothetical protein
VTIEHRSAAGQYDRLPALANDLVRRRVTVIVTILGSAMVAGCDRLIMDGLLPARVPDAVISEIRSRERGGFVELPKVHGLKPGMRVKVLQGPLQDHIGLLAALRPHERVLVLLQLLSGQQRVELARNAVEVVQQS